MPLTCYLIKDKATGTVAYEYWAKAPYDWVGTHYPWADAEYYETVEAPVQPAVAPSETPVVTGQWLPAFDFMRKFSIGEQAAIQASADPVIGVFLARLEAAIAANARILKDDQDTIDGLAYLVGAGILTTQRVAEIWA